MENYRLYLKKLSKFLFNRIFYVIVAIVFQVTWIIVQFYRLAGYSNLINTVLTIVSIILVLVLVNRDMNPSYKLFYTILILSLPIFGIALFVLIGESRLTSSIDKRYNRTVNRENANLKESTECREELEKADIMMDRQSAYIRNVCGMPVWNHTRTEYFQTGDDLFPVLLKELENAQHFIFIEYFMINYGVMWESIFKILERKAAEGIDVRIIYDDFGCLTTLPAGYYKELREHGIRCEVFNRFRLIANIIHNNRDHRKICIIDGFTGFTGGVNLSDEYINRKKRFGTWKDTAIMLQGDAVWNMTAMFLQMWNVVTHSDEEIPYYHYEPKLYRQPFSRQEGFVQPFGDSPLDHESVGENVYIHILNHARKYVYIYTPYLIIDHELSSALCLAASSGVDVRIITPGVPDKKIVYLLTKSYYSQLVKAGVKIFQYLPGFLHAKSFVCDDKVAVCGTINLDYRSLYLHFEDGVWIYNSHTVLDIRDDFLNTLASCRRVTYEECRNASLPTRIMQNIFRVLSPML